MLKVGRQGDLGLFLLLRKHYTTYYTNALITPGAHSIRPNGMITFTESGHTHTLAASHTQNKSLDHVRAPPFTLLQRLLLRTFFSLPLTATGSRDDCQLGAIDSAIASGGTLKGTNSIKHRQRLRLMDYTSFSTHKYHALPTLSSAPLVFPHQAPLLGVPKGTKDATEAKEFSRVSWENRDNSKF